MTVTGAPVKGLIDDDLSRVDAYYALCAGEHSSASSALAFPGCWPVPRVIIRYFIGDSPEANRDSRSQPSQVEIRLLLGSRVRRAPLCSSLRNLAIKQPCFNPLSNEAMRRPGFLLCDLKSAGWKDRFEYCFKLALDTAKPLLHGIQALIEPPDLGPEFSQQGFESGVEPLL